MGIDYGMGIANIDPETGIRYGVIGLNSVSIEALGEDCESVDVNYEAWSDEVHQVLLKGLEAPKRFKALATRLEPLVGARHSDLVALGDVCMSVFRGHRTIEAAAREMFLVYAANYDNDCGDYRYRIVNDKYVVHQVDDTDIFVEKSPWVTRAAFCSPCAPGAGSLGSCETISNGDGLAGDCWAYALGPEFFDEWDPMPYRVIPAVNVTAQEEWREVAGE